MLAWFLGSLAGATAAITISRRNWSAWIVASGMVALSFLTTQMFPHPVWMVVAGVLLPLAAAMLARRLVARRLTG